MQRMPFQNRLHQGEQLQNTNGRPPENTVRFEKNERKRQETLERITSVYGTQLRMNRSIQAEGSFANIKEDMEFRRYLYRGNANVTAQSILLAIGYNINKLHHKIQAGRTGRHLFPLKQTADFDRSKVNPESEPFFRKGLLKFAFL